MNNIDLILSQPDETRVTIKVEVWLTAGRPASNLN